MPSVEFEESLKALRREHELIEQIMTLKALLTESRKMLFQKAVYFNADQMLGDAAGLIEKIDKAIE